MRSKENLEVRQIKAWQVFLQHHHSKCLAGKRKKGFIFFNQWFFTPLTKIYLLPLSTEHVKEVRSASIFFRNYWRKCGLRRVPMSPVLQKQPNVLFLCMRLSFDYTEMDHMFEFNILPKINRKCYKKSQNSNDWTM